MIPLHAARKYADRVVELLAPHCERIEIAGSVRREEEEVGDIDVVCIPREGLKQALDAFDTLPRVILPISGFEENAARFKAVKWEPTGFYATRILPNTETALNVFVAEPDNWGWRLAARTGSDDFNTVVWLRGLKRIGHDLGDGFIYDFRGDILKAPRIAIREEQELFDLIGLKFIHPRDRRGDVNFLRKLLDDPALQDSCSASATQTPGGHDFSQTYGITPEKGAVSPEDCSNLKDRAPRNINPYI